MPGVDKECTTHYACDCIMAKVADLEAQLHKYKTGSIVDELVAEKVELEKENEVLREQNFAMNKSTVQLRSALEKANEACELGVCKATEIIEQALKGEGE